MVVSSVKVTPIKRHHLPSAFKAFYPHFCYLFTDLGVRDLNTIPLLYVTSDSRRSVNDIFALLGC
jgi:hypothetical protein